MENQNKNSGGVWGLIVVIILVLALFGSCSNSSDSYSDMLMNARKKAVTGEKLNKQEKQALKGFNEWKSNQD